jgi:hypothetical protein
LTFSVLPPIQRYVILSAWYNTTIISGLYCDGCDIKVIHRGLRHISLTQHAESKLCKPLHIPDLYFTDTADAFASTVEEIDFRLAPELMEVEQQLELNTENSMKRNGNAFLVQIQFGF